MNIAKLMKQAEKMQAKMLEVQEELAKKTVEATSGGGMVKAVASGDGMIVSIKIDPQVVSANDIEMLEDLVVAAVNTALENVKSLVTEEMKKVTGGIGIPGFM
ncbi:MAG: YbaB/EbfC family nucleoid-associated protein [bacterium]|nr:YbaB/EbfC family nucleoid-associated protein [bacterium]